MMDLYRYRPLPRDSALNGHRLVITTDVLESVAHMLPKRVKWRDHENVLYLAGAIDDTTRYAFVVLAPKVITTPGSYTTDRDSHAEVIWELANNDLVVVAQVHCHPGTAVYHSDADDELAFVKGEGFWSIVVPNYGRRGIMPLSACGFHCYSDGEFRLLEQEAVKSRIVVVNSRIDFRRGA